MAKIKLKTIDNPLAVCVIGLMNEAEEPEFERVHEQLIEVMLQQESDQSLEEGVADGLLTYLGALADGDCVLLDGTTAETTMRDAYVFGYSMALRDKVKVKDVREDVYAGNSGWWWPQALTYKRGIDIYPLHLCEHFGLMLGYKHARETSSMQAYLESPEGKAQLAAIEKKNQEARARA